MALLTAAKTILAPPTRVCIFRVFRHPFVDLNLGERPTQHLNHVLELKLRPTTCVVSRGLCQSEIEQLRFLLNFVQLIHLPANVDNTAGGKPGAQTLKEQNRNKGTEKCAQQRNGKTRAQ